MVPPAGFNNWFDSLPEGVESTQPEQSQESQEKSLLLNINSSTQLKCYCILFRLERPEKFLLWNEHKYINWNFVAYFHVGCILQVNFLLKRVLQEDLTAYHAKKYGIIFDQFVPFHTCGPQFLKFYSLIQTLQHGCSFKSSLFSVNTHLRMFPQCLVSTARARLEKLQVLCKSGLCLHVEDEAVAPAQLRLCGDATSF